ncbi:hypothetical protein [Variovorax sp. PCZ-1]|uniref:hypothetical protein n=1 Tax=Variovorax sp. PCZ-1 TaxID=2835533 RepID=UPI001BCAFC91|nr:hypothetical protein [Variovorax sp. PCZ-1]MBS7807997.1 hypothetical protein [Variovorax sp. PCZ-1]
MKNLWNSQPTIVCPACGTFLPLQQYFPFAYFHGAKTACAYCKAEFDLWDSAIKILSQEPLLFRKRGAAFIGAHELSFVYQLPAEATVEIDLHELGVPLNSKLLYIVHSPTSEAAWPLELSSNQLTQRKRTNKLMFYGRPFPKSHESITCSPDVSISITYLPPSSDQISSDQLALACEYLLEDQYEKMLLPCAVAVEQITQRTVFDVLKKLGLPTNHEPNKRLGLEVILPMASQLLDIPKLDNRVTNLIAKLWRLRNQMAHQGSVSSGVKLAEVAEIFVASIFCVNHLSMVRQDVEQKSIFQNLK